MADDTFKRILAEYDEKKTVYDDFSKRCEILLKELLEVEGYRVHSVTSRFKDRDKLREKIEREGKSYTCLSDITDVAGARIITHFEDEVDKVGSLVEREFKIDRSRSIDKRKILDPDRFGYLSLHYICSLNEDRQKLSENRLYDRVCCEIQIRSILQHAWAEIEHDLGYKPNTTVPAPIRRRFSRLAGLLELADQEFESIRNELKAYEARVPEEIRSTPSEVEIDDVSIAAFMRDEPLVRAIDNEIANAADAKIDKSGPTANKKLADHLRYTGIATIDALRRGLIENRRILVCQVKGRQALSSYSSLREGASLWYLAHTVLALRGEAELTQYFEKYQMHFPNMTPADSAAKLTKVIQDCMSGTEQ